MMGLFVFLTVSLRGQVKMDLGSLPWEAIPQPWHQNKDAPVPHVHLPHSC